MVVLKKIKGATLMETMVATVLIVVIFMVASLVMGSLMRARGDSTQKIASYLKKIEYQYANERLEIPYFETWEEWEISILENSEKSMEMTALDTRSNKELVVQLPKTQWKSKK